MNPSRSFTALALASVALASSLHAQTLVQYNFTGSSVTAQRTASLTDPNVTADPFANGAGVSIDRSSVNSSGGTGNYRSIFAKPSTVDEPLSATSTDWVGFTISAAPGNVLNLSNLSFDYAYSYNSGTVPATPAYFDVYVSADNWSTSASLGTFSQSVPATTNTIDWDTASIGLSAAAYQGLESVSFRIVLNDGANASDTSYIRLDAVTLSGTAAAIPEPSTAAALVGLCGLGFAATRRRRAA